MAQHKQGSHKINRRKFFKFGGAAIAGATINISPIRKAISMQDETDAEKIKSYRILGRTGFKVSDIGMGTNRNVEPSVIRYAYDKGVNYFDSAEGYGNGRSERMIGEALKFMDRNKVFITTKIHVNDNETKESIIDRCYKCLERMQTEYVDAFFMHGPSYVSSLIYPAYHEAIAQLKSDGKVKHAGVSCHGPRGNDGDSMEKVLCAAAEDGRFDLMLLTYSFMNYEPGDKILAACKKFNVGTTAMKTAPGILKVEPIDPDNLSEDQQEYVTRMMERGSSKEEAIERLNRRLASQKESHEKSKPFIDKWGIKTNDQLRKTSIHWVSQNPDMHTTCVSFVDFDLIDNIIPISGEKLSQLDRQFLDEFKFAFNDRYCRHGCNQCVAACPHHLPVSTMMRYAYYYVCQGKEKDAMQKYAHLNKWNAAYCHDCDAPCLNSCPYGVNVQANLIQAHSLLTLA